MQDLVKWGLKDENRAIQDAVTQVGELFSVWTEVQRDFSAHIKEFQHQFDMILEGAKQLDLAKVELQSVARAKDQIKRFRRRSGSSVSTPGRVQDLPPPYSENPPMNPFYSERHDLSGPDLDHSGLDDSRPLVVSPPSQPAATHDPLYQHQQHLYPLLHPIAPPYQTPDSPPPFSLLPQQPHPHPFLGSRQEVVTPGSRPFLRREDSYLSDGEASEAVAGLANLHLRPHPR